MKFGIVTFPGSNCDYDAYRAVVEALGEDATYLWHKDHDLHGSDVVVLPGGLVVDVTHHPMPTSDSSPVLIPVSCPVALLVDEFWYRVHSLAASADISCWV